MSCDVGKSTEGLENELWRRWSDGNVGEWAPTSQALLILQTFRHFTYITTHSPTPFRRFTYVTAHSPTLPLLHLRHSSFPNPSLASPTSQALHLIHLARRPWTMVSRDKWKAFYWHFLTVMEYSGYTMLIHIIWKFTKMLLNTFIWSLKEGCV